MKETAVFEHFLTLLPAYRREKIERLRFDKDKRLSLGAGLLLRKVMEDAGIDPLTVPAYGENGKPYLKEHPCFHYNLSHSEEGVLCIASGEEAGCDTEYAGAKRENIAERIFYPEELSLWEREKDEKKKTALFFRLWTLKESYLKCTGEGFSAGPRSFGVLPEENGAKLVSDTDMRNYRFFTFLPEESYPCSCCIQTADGTFTPSFKTIDFKTLL